MLVPSVHASLSQAVCPVAGGGEDFPSLSLRKGWGEGFTREPQDWDQPRSVESTPHFRPRVSTRRRVCPSLSG